MKLPKKLPSILLLIACFSTKMVFAETIVLVKNNADPSKKLLSLTSLPFPVQKVVNNIKAKQPDLYQIVVYKTKDNYRLYLLSGKTWAASVVNLAVNPGTQSISTIEPTEIGEQDTDNQIGICPDESVEFVAISAYSMMPSVSKAVDTVYNAASKRYNAVKILTKANGETYRNWLSCPNLKGFYSIGHGSPTAIIVGDGDIISWKFFNNPELVKKYNKTTLIFNHCKTYNYPFGTSALMGAALTPSEYEENPGPGAYEFIGGYTDLLMYYSEKTSACFTEKIIHGEKINHDTVKSCLGGLETGNLSHSFGITYRDKVMQH